MGLVFYLSRVRPVFSALFRAASVAAKLYNHQISIKFSRLCECTGLFVSRIHQMQVFTLFKTNLRENVLGTLDRNEHVAAY